MWSVPSAWHRIKAVALRPIATAATLGSGWPTMPTRRSSQQRIRLTRAETTGATGRRRRPGSAGGESVVHVRKRIGYCDARTSFIRR